MALYFHFCSGSRLLLQGQTSASEAERGILLSLSASVCLKSDVDKPQAQSVVNALQVVLKQRDLKIATRTLQNFVKEIDHVAPWYACSGSLTTAS